MSMMDAANQNAMIQGMMWEDFRKRQEPYMDIGKAAVDPFGYALNLPGYEQPEGYDLGETIEGIPGYNWLVDKGLESLERKAASRGMLQSGPVAKGMYDYATQQVQFPMYQDYMNRLFQTMGLGQGASAQVGQAGMGMATNVGNALMQGAQYDQQMEMANKQNQGSWLNDVMGGVGLLGSMALAPATGGTSLIGGGLSALNNTRIGNALGWKM